MGLPSSVTARRRARVGWRAFGVVWMLVYVLEAVPISPAVERDTPRARAGGGRVVAIEPPRSEIFSDGFESGDTSAWN